MTVRGKFMCGAGERRADGARAAGGAAIALKVALKFGTAAWADSQSNCTS